MTSRQTAVPAGEPAQAGRAREPASAGALRGPALARLLLTALLIAGVLVGLRGGFALHGWHGPYRRDGIAIGVALEVILAGLLVALLIRGRRPSDDFRVHRLRGVLRAALLAGLAAIPAVLILAVPLHPHPLPPQPLPTQPQPTARPSLTRPPHPGPAFRLPLAGILYALLILALIAGIVACVWLLRRRLPEHEVLPPEETSLAEGQRSDLRDAVSSGRLDDARAAIIACYVAMERSLAAAGADHEAADTPDEFLARAAAAGLVRGAAAGELTGLFYEARFSAHELTTAQRDAAQGALEQLAADLRDSS
jgi:hypothetical protein